MAIRRIGQIFVDMGFIGDEQLQMLLEEQQQRPGTLIGRLAQELNMLTEEQLVQALSEQMGMQIVDLGDMQIPHDVLTKVSESMAQLYRAIPIHFEGNRLTVATCDPQNITIQDELRSLLGYEVKVVIAGETDVVKTLDKYYSSDKDTIESIIIGIEEDDDLKKTMNALEAGKPLELADVEALADSAPVRKLLNMVLLLAIKDHASDIHFEPFEDEFRIRIKADGVLFEMVPPPRHLAFAITTRIKVMANLDIAERRLPQDGRIRVSAQGKEIDFRVATSPTLHGESVVLRILDRQDVALDFDALGFDPSLKVTLREAIARPFGIVLVTGPTGSGKTTTLYAALREINTPDRKILTVEDPVEYVLTGVNQVPVRPQIGLTFAQALRSFLRQDPDVLMVGEIRDRETAEIAIQAALTGHLLFSTLHTNSAAAGVTRLLGMGIDGYLLTSTLHVILGQRLVRRLCMECREPFTPSKEVLTRFALSADEVSTWYRARGCSLCHNTGFRGRTAILEALRMSDGVRAKVLTRADAHTVERVAIEEGMRTMLGHGLQRVGAGMTTIEEVLRVTSLS